MAHLRRKLQIINYFKTDELVFDYEKCLDNISMDKEEKESLGRLYQTYKNRKVISSREVKQYRDLARQFTKRIV